jgi:hypothetical protein
MATFMEAMQAAREGKRVRPHPDCVINGRWHRWGDGRLWIEASRTHPADVCAMYLDCEWEIEQPPPKRYTFLEAVALMEQHKVSRIRSVLSGHQFHLVSYDSLLFSRVAQRGPTIQEIQGQWEEVQ